MHKDKFVFTQLVQFMDRNHFNYLVRKYDGDRYIFLTNNMESSPLLISEFYRNRWSVELFFKWEKQHLRIKKFWGTSENAVRIQIYCAITTYCLVAIVQHDMKLERSIYEVLQILGNLFDR